MQQFLKDPDAVLDYGVDWSSWLQTAEAISSHTVTVDTGITKDSDSETDGIVTVWLSGGTVGETYEITVRIITDAGRTDDRTFSVLLVER